MAGRAHMAREREDGRGPVVKKWWRPERGAGVAGGKGSGVDSLA